MLKVENLRRFDRLEVTLAPFTLLVGPNDAGKTTLLRAIRVICGQEEKLDLDQVRRDPTTPTGRAATCAIEVHIAEPSPSLRSTTGIAAGMIGFRAEWRVEGTNPEDAKLVGPSWSIQALVPKDEKLREGAWPKLAGDQAALLTALGQTAASNADGREAQWRQLQEVAVKTPAASQSDWKSTKRETVLKHLPYSEKIDTAQVQDPLTLLEGLLRKHARNLVYPTTEEGDSTRPQALRDLEVEVGTKLQQRLNALVPFLRRQQPQVTSVQVRPEWDFIRGARFGRINLFHGAEEVPLAELGAGSSARSSLAMLEWDAATAPNDGAFLVRTMDEPDTSLHFDAQRHLVHLLLADLDGQKGRMDQCIVSTHSLVMVDATPLDRVVYVPKALPDDRSLRPLVTRDEAMDGRLLGAVREGLGVPASWIFFEKAMILVEGESEFNYVREAYHRVTGSTLVADGVQVWDSQGCGNVHTTIKRLKAGARARIFVMLDEDARQREADGARLEDALLAEGFVNGQDLVFLGTTKELEEAFREQDIVAVANTHWPREDEAPWEEAHFQGFREADKPSGALLHIIKQGRGALNQGGGRVSKPLLAKAMAKHPGVEHPAALPALLQTVNTHCRGPVLVPQQP
jgi:predicted ATPase